jgi:ribosomal protein S18 acetylase RimI-like enzyme
MKKPSMKVKSLGYRTDLIFPAFDGEIIDRGSYFVVRTPFNPTFYWGNFLLFDQPPGEGDYDLWRALFAKEIGIPPEIRHMTFGWDTIGGEQGNAAPFLENGFHLDSSTVLTSRKLNPPARPAADLIVRPLLSDDDWAQSLENQIACREPEFSEREYIIFRRRQVDRYRAMVARGMGDWFGGFLGTRLVADLGIFHSGMLGRYQSVQTHPYFRRRGMAGTLVYESGKYAMGRFGLDMLVIVAETGAPAERLYQSVGFQGTEYQVHLEKWKGETERR